MDDEISIKIKRQDIDSANRLLKKMGTYWEEIEKEIKKPGIGIILINKMNNYKANVDNLNFVIMQLISQLPKEDNPVGINEVDWESQHQKIAELPVQCENNACKYNKITDPIHHNIPEKMPMLAIDGDALYTQWKQNFIEDNEFQDKIEQFLRSLFQDMIEDEKSQKKIKQIFWSGFQENQQQKISENVSNNISEMAKSHKTITKEATFPKEKFNLEALPNKMRIFIEKYNKTQCYRQMIKLKLSGSMEDLRANTMQRYISDEESKRTLLEETPGTGKYFCELIEGENDLYYVVPPKNLLFDETKVCQGAYEDFFYFNSRDGLYAEMGNYELEKPAIFEKLNDGTYRMVERGRIKLKN